MGTSVEIVALDGALDTQLAMTLDVLGAANRLAAALQQEQPFSFRLVGSVGRSVRTGSGYRLETDGRFGAMARGGLPQVIVVLGINAPTAPELEAVLKRPDVRRAEAYLRRRHLEGTLVCGACSATFLLAEAGLLDGRVATTSWWLAPVFRDRYPAVSLTADEALAINDGVICGGAAMSQIDLMLHLVRTRAGPELADLCARYLLIDERASQARFMVTDHLRHHSEEVSRVDRYVRQHLSRRLGIAVLARAAATSPRTLARRFQRALGISPLRFVRWVRAERAVLLLQTTSLPIEAIAEKVGYADPVALRRLVRRATGRSPRDVRAARSHAAAFGDPRKTSR